MQRVLPIIFWLLPAFIISISLVSKHVEVVMPYEKKLLNNFELGLGSQLSIAPKFVFHYAPTFEVSFHFNELFSIRGNVGYNFYRGPTDLSGYLKRESSFSGELVSYYERTFMGQLLLEISPLIGKMALFDSYIMRMHGVIEGGFGISRLLLFNGPLLGERLEPGSHLAPTAIFGGGLRLFIADNFVLRLLILDLIEPLAVKKNQFAKGIVEQNEFLIRHDWQAYLSLGMVL